MSALLRIFTIVVATWGYATPSLAQNGNAYGNSGPDLNGTPDLIVDTKNLSHQWVVRDEKLAADSCSVIEGGVSAGTHRLLRFTVTTPNIGGADIVVGDPNAHIAANDGLFEFALCHKHYHFKHYALYELIDKTGYTWKAAKRGFCMLDTDPWPADRNGNPPRNPYYRACGSVGVPGNQGISHGRADTYRFFLGGQYFVLDGGDGQAPVPPGDYIIRVTVNPPFRPAPQEPCPHVDTQGYCHQLPESDYTNNIGEVTVTIPDKPGKGGFGPMANTPVPNSESDEHGDPIQK